MSISSERAPGVLHKDGFIVGKHGQRIYHQRWLPENDPVAVVLMVHGLFEHSGRYEPLARFLVPKGFELISYDHRGHGKSEGMRGYVNRFVDFLDDLKTLADAQGISAGRTKPTFIFGHSVGGLIATIFAAENQERFDGLILSGPTIKPGSSVNSMSMIVARVLSAVLPRMGVSKIEADGICSDPDVVRAYLDDPLVYTGRIRARLGGELLNAMERLVPSLVDRIELPVLLLQGTEDRLSNASGADYLYEKIRSADKTLRRYPGLCHEVLNEPERQVVLDDISTWLRAHSGGSKKNFNANTQPKGLQ